MAGRSRVQQSPPVHQHFDRSRRGLHTRARQQEAASVGRDVVAEACRIDSRVEQSLGRADDGGRKAADGDRHHLAVRRDVVNLLAVAAPSGRIAAALSQLTSLGKFDKKKAAAIQELGINPEQADPVTA